MAWVTFEDLLAKAGAQSVGAKASFMQSAGAFEYVFNASNFNQLNKNEKAALGELYDSAVNVMKQAGVPPDETKSVYSHYNSGGDTYVDEVKVPIWSLETIKEALNSRGIKLAYDPSRDKGNWGSSRGYSIQLGMLDAANNPVQEYRVGDGSFASLFFKGFVVPFASLALTANAGAIGAAIAPGAPVAAQSAIGSAVASGASTALSGGDAEDVIKNALTGGAVGAASSLVKPYIQDAIDFVKDLAPGDLEQIAGSVDATAGAADVAGDLGQVEAGGEQIWYDSGADVGVDLGGAEVGYVDPLSGGFGFDYAGGINNVALAQLSPSAQEVYLEALRQGATESTAMSRAVTFNNTLLKEGFTSAAVDTSMNALAGGAAAEAAGAAGSAGGATGATGATNALAGGDVVSTQVTPTERVATVDLTGQQTAGTTGTGLGTAAAGAGAAGAAGTAGAGTAGAGGLMTEADLAGLSSDIVTTPPEGTDVLGGTDATGAGVAAGAATGAITAGGAAAAGLTGIKAVDDFLSYLGTPAGAMALSAFGGLAGGYFQGQAAKEAAQTQATAAQNALALQREMFEYQKGLLEPYQQAGTAALGRLTGVMGLGGQPATGGQQLLEMDPGYAFRLGEGMKALERLQAARGNMLSGGAIKAGQRYAQDVASQEYGNAYNRLANIAGLGQTTGTQLGAAGQQFGSAAGETMAQQANALAAGRVGRVSAYTQGINTAANAFGNYLNQQQRNQVQYDIYGRQIGG